MTVVASPPKAPVDDGSLTHRQILTILIGLMMGMFLAALDQTIVGTAIRTIADDLHGLAIQAWVTTAYLITSTITTPLYGKLSDIYGRKKFFVAAISIFIVGSAMCSFATSMYMLASFRAVQGVGAGGLFSLSLAIIGDIVSPRERAKYQGYFLAVFGTSSVLGPVIGGFFAGHASILGITGWRWVFLVNVPVGIAALFVVTKTLHLNHVRHEHRIDWWGATWLIVALVPLLTVAQQGRVWGWGSGRSLTSFFIGTIGVIAFIWAEARMGEDALIPLRIFKSRAITITIVGSMIVGIGMFGGIMTLPLYLQIVHQATPMSSGFMMLPLVLGIMTSSIISGQLIYRTGKVRVFPIFGTALMIVGLLLLWRVSADTSLWIVMAFMLVFGLGLGNTMQPLTLIVQNAVAPREIGMATSAATFFRQMGGTLGVAVFLSILFSTVGDKIQGALKAALPTPGFQQALQDPAMMENPKSAGIVEALTHPQAGGGGSQGTGGVLDDSSVLGSLNDTLARPFRVGFSEAMDSVFLIGACVVVVGFIVLAFLPRIELRTQSGMQVAAAERAAEAAAAEDDQGGADADGDTGAATIAADAGRADPADGIGVTYGTDAEATDATQPADAQATEAASGMNGSRDVAAAGRDGRELDPAAADRPETGDPSVGVSDPVQAAIDRAEARRHGDDSVPQPRGRHRG